MMAQVTIMKATTATTLIPLTQNSTSPKMRTGQTWMVRLMTMKMEIQRGVKAGSSFQ